jgi:colanic acid biosynthesis glycosyl transferase WcaI
MKKIVFVINYYYPDLASTGQLMTDLTRNIQEDFEITVIAAQPGYAGEKVDNTKILEYELFEKMKIIRLKLPEVNKLSKVSRIKYIFKYFFLALMALLKEEKINVIYTISQPPILGGLIGTIGKLVKRSKHVYNIQDFNPEQANAVNFASNKVIYFLAKFIDKINCKYSDEIILVGNDMADTLKRRFNNKKVPHYTVINNWTDEDDITPIRDNEQIQKFKKEHGINGKFIVMYSGNIGLYYDLENIISITNHFKDNKDIVFVFIGEGAVKDKMQKFTNENNLSNVLFLPYQPKEFIKYSLNAADLHLVVNQKGIKGVSVPSKIYGVMAAGKPILGVLEQGSEAERLISESKCGAVVEPQNYKGIIEKIEFFYEMNNDKLNEIGLCGREYLDENLKKKTSINKYREILKSL